MTARFSPLASIRLQLIRRVVRRHRARVNGRVGIGWACLLFVGLAAGCSRSDTQPTDEARNSHAAQLLSPELRDSLAAMSAVAQRSRITGPVPSEPDNICGAIDNSQRCSQAAHSDEIGHPFRSYSDTCSG